MPQDKKPTTPELLASIETALDYGKNAHRQMFLCFPQSWTEQRETFLGAASALALLAFRFAELEKATRVKVLEGVAIEILQGFIMPPLIYSDPIAEAEGKLYWKILDLISRQLAEAKKGE